MKSAYITPLFFLMLGCPQAHWQIKEDLKLQYVTDPECVLRALRHIKEIENVEYADPSNLTQSQILASNVRQYKFNYLGQNGRIIFDKTSSDAKISFYGKGNKSSESLNRSVSNIRNTIISNIELLCSSK